MCRRTALFDRNSLSQTDARTFSYVLERGDDLRFTKAFWKGCEPHKKELEQYPRYVEALTKFARGLGASEISRETRVNLTSILHWVRFEQRPKLGHYLQEYLSRGEPKEGWVWLSVNNTSGHAVPLGPFVQVPLEIRGWKQVKEVIDNLPRLDTNDSRFSRAYLFGFILGIAIGDAGKKRQKQWHRHLDLNLSMRYQTSERIGDFACICARAIGLRMHKMSNKERYGTKPHGFFVWESQSSALVDWIFNVCLGLHDGELTTYNPVRMNWALSAPVDFRRGLIQGMAESDGSVNVSGQEVEFWIGPSWDFVKALLRSFGINSFRSRGALAIAKSQVKKALEVPIFAPHLATVRFQKFSKLANANHIARGRRIPPRIRNRVIDLASSGLSVPKISERILDEFGTILTYEATQRWASKATKSSLSCDE